MITLTTDPFFYLTFRILLENQPLQGTVLSPGNHGSVLEQDSLQVNRRYSQQYNTHGETHSSILRIPLYSRRSELNYRRNSEKAHFQSVAKYCKTAHLSHRYTTTAFSFLSRSSACTALPLEYAAEVDCDPASETDLNCRLTSNTLRKTEHNPSD